MENKQITKLVDGAKTYFTVKEGSNYAVVDSFENRYVVEFGQFQNISRSIFNTDSDFVTINNVIINKRYIYKIEPTTERTEQQKAEAALVLEAEDLKAKKFLELDVLYKKVRNSYMDKVYGKGIWRLRNISPDDVEGIWELLDTKYPLKAEELRKLTR